MQQGTKEWLEFRRTRIGASDAPIIMGVSPWTKPMELWEEKVGMRDGKKLSESMKRGQILETIARQEFEKVVEVDIFPQVVTHPEHSWMVASLDGLSLDGKCAVEIKCPGEKTHAIAVGGNIPEHYYPQLQHQLAVLGIPFMHYYSFNGTEGVLLTVERDEQYISELIEKEQLFYEAMRTQTPPDPSILGHETTDEWQPFKDRLEELKALKKAIDNEEAAIKDKLIEQAGGKNCVGNGIELFKRYRKGSINYGAIPELKSVDLEAYRKAPSEYWSLTLKKN